MASARQLILVALAAACACSDSAHRKPEPAPAPAVGSPGGVTDGGVDAQATAVRFDPSVGHLDDDPSVPSGPRPTSRKPTRPVEIFLRSAPTGAQVHVDGMDKGTTPVLWQGETGEHEFTFVLKDHALARYRFWVITNGVVHARLEPVTEEVDAGVPPPEVVPVTGVTPPPTLVAPDATPNVMMPAIDAGTPPSPSPPGSPGLQP